MKKLYSIVALAIAFWIVACGAYQWMVVGYYDASGKAYEGYDSENSKMVVLFGKNEKFVIVTDAENRLTEMWRMTYRARKWGWFGFCVYMKPSLNESSYGDGAFALLRLRFRPTASVPTTLTEKIIAHATFEEGKGYYDPVSKRDSFTEEATFLDDGLKMGNANMKAVEIDKDTFESLCAGIGKQLAEGKASCRLGEKVF